MTKPSSRLRVLMVSDVYFPRVNGVSTSIATFRRELAQLGCESVLIAPAYPQQSENEDDVIRIPSWRVPFDPEDRSMRLARAAEAIAGLEGAFDVVHIQTPFVADRLGRAFAKRSGRPTITTYHTYFEEYFHQYLRWLPRAPLRSAARRLSRAQCNAVDHVIAPSRVMADILAAYGVRTPIEVLPTGIDLDAFANGDGARFRAERGISPERPVILHVGRAAHEKNIGFLIDVAAHVRVQISDVLLVIAGEGPALESLRRNVAERGLDENVLFVGYLDRRTALLDCYRSADALVFASRTETQGLVPLEAMAVGTPVVSTAVLGTAEIVEPGRGAIPVPEEVEQFARTVIHVLTSAALRAQLSREGRRYVAECWSSRAMAQRLLAIYAGLSTTAERRAEIGLHADAG